MAIDHMIDMLDIQLGKLRMRMNDFQNFKRIFSRDYLISKEIPNLLKELESSTIITRNLYEAYGNPHIPEAQSKPVAENLFIYGSISVDEEIIMIKLNTLLPHCRFDAPEYLTDTLDHLFRNYKKEKSLPYFQKALIVIDEHSKIKMRKVYDQDNKGWKSIPNIIKIQGIIPDDNQSHMDIALMSTEDENLATYIFILDAKSAPDFFLKKSKNQLKI